jgi:glucosyl-3-phosphoglycerate synthase
MSDFYQNGIVTNLHNLRSQHPENLEKELIEFSKSRPLGLVLPSLYSELLKPALKNIVD